MGTCAASATWCRVVSICRVDPAYFSQGTRRSATVACNSCARQRRARAQTQPGLAQVTVGLQVRACSPRGTRVSTTRVLARGGWSSDSRCSHTCAGRGAPKRVLEKSKLLCITSRAPCVGLVVRKITSTAKRRAPATTRSSLSTRSKCRRTEIPTNLTLATRVTHLLLACGPPQTAHSSRRLSPHAKEARSTRVRQYSPLPFTQNHTAPERAASRVAQRLRDRPLSSLRAHEHPHRRGSGETAAPGRLGSLFCHTRRTRGSKRVGVSAAGPKVLRVRAAAILFCGGRVRARRARLQSAAVMLASTRLRSPRPGVGRRLG